MVLTKGDDLKTVKKSNIFSVHVYLTEEHTVVSLEFIVYYHRKHSVYLTSRVRLYFKETLTHL